MWNCAAKLLKEKSWNKGRSSPGLVIFNKFNISEQLHDDKLQPEIEEVPDLSHLEYTHRMHEDAFNLVTPAVEISGPTHPPEVEPEFINEAPPPLTLTKAELLALYETAVVKASQAPSLQGKHPLNLAQNLDFSSSLADDIQGMLQNFFAFMLNSRSI